MPDRRFFADQPPLTVDRIADLVGGTVVRGGDRPIHAVAPLGSANGLDIAFLSDRKRIGDLASTLAACVIVPAAAADSVPAHASVIASPTPQAAWARASLTLHHPILLTQSAATNDVVEDASVSLAPGVVLGVGTRIGRGTRVGANTVIGPGVQIGRDCVIGANVTIGFALIGDRVTLSAGARIGEPGFGAAPSREGPVDVPQLGRVILQDGVSVGANTCIDRGAYGDTIVGENSKIDNLCHIAHNCILGRNVLMAAQTGLAGTIRVGDNVMFGGQAGVGDHLDIGDGARVAGGAGVLADIPAGETWSGYPAKPLRQSLREAIWLSKQVGPRSGPKQQTSRGEGDD